jgi:hypothetical protein
MYTPHSELTVYDNCCGVSKLGIPVVVVVVVGRLVVVVLVVGIEVVV